MYDFRPSTLFFETVGISGRYQTDKLEILGAVGDSGYAMRRGAYNSIFTAVDPFAIDLFPKTELDLVVNIDMKWVPKEINSPYASPNVDYEDVLRGEVIQNFMLENPLNVNQQFPIPELRDANSYKAIAYLGFGGFGPIIWNNFSMLL